MEPLKFNFYGNPARIYKVGDIVHQAMKGDILYVPKEEVDETFYVYNGSSWESHFTPSDNDRAFLLHRLHLNLSPPITLAVKITDIETQNKYNVFESKLKL